MRFFSFFFNLMYYVRELAKKYVKYIIISIPSYYLKQAVFVLVRRNCDFIMKTDHAVGLFFIFLLHPHTKINLMMMMMISYSQNFFGTACSFLCEERSLKNATVRYFFNPLYRSVSSKHQNI